MPDLNNKVSSEIELAIDEGAAVEKEHSDTYAMLKEYVKDNGELPPAEDFYKSISSDHVTKEGKNYYKMLKQFEPMLKKGSACISRYHAFKKQTGAGSTFELGSGDLEIVPSYENGFRCFVYQHGASGRRQIGSAFKSISSAVDAFKPYGYPIWYKNIQLYDPIKGVVASKMVSARVVKDGSLWYVESEAGKRLSKGYDSETDANKRLGQIEFFKKKSAAKVEKKPYLGVDIDAVEIYSENDVRVCLSKNPVVGNDFAIWVSWRDTGDFGQTVAGSFNPSGAPAAGSSFPALPKVPVYVVGIADDAAYRYLKDKTVSKFVEAAKKKSFDVLGGSKSFTLIAEFPNLCEIYASEDSGLLDYVAVSWSDDGIEYKVVGSFDKFKNSVDFPKYPPVPAGVANVAASEFRQFLDSAFVHLKDKPVVAYSTDDPDLSQATDEQKIRAAVALFLKTASDSEPVEDLIPDAADFLAYRVRDRDFDSVWLSALSDDEIQHTLWSRVGDPKIKGLLEVLGVSGNEFVKKYLKYWYDLFKVSIPKFSGDYSEILLDVMNTDELVSHAQKQRQSSEEDKAPKEKVFSVSIFDDSGFMLSSYQTSPSTKKDAEDRAKQVMALINGSSYTIDPVVSVPKKDVEKSPEGKESLSSKKRSRPLVFRSNRKPFPDKDVRSSDSDLKQLNALILEKAPFSMIAAAFDSDAFFNKARPNLIQSLEQSIKGVSDLNKKSIATAQYCDLKNKGAVAYLVSTLGQKEADACIRSDLSCFVNIKKLLSFAGHKVS